MVDELEKRKFLRLKFPLDVTVEIVPVQGAPNDPPRVHVKSRNISKGGICLEMKSLKVDGINLMSGRPFARENRLYLSMALIPGEPLLTATGEVRWYDVARDIPEFIYRLGVAFIEVPDDGKDRLEGFLKQNEDNK